MKKRLGDPTLVGDIAKTLLQIIQEQAEQNAASFEKLKGQ